MVRHSIAISRVLVASCWLAFLSSVIGCGSSSDVPLYEATGVVRLEGMPVDYAVVAFVPTQQNGATAVAMTDEMGAFTLKLPPGRKGVPAGTYKVSIKKTSSREVESPEPITFEDMEREHKSGIKRKPPVFKPGVPPRYGDPQTSTLQVEVSPSAKNEFTFDLKG